jgi:hypothetical protein
VTMNVCVASATGWAGCTVAEAVHSSDVLRLAQIQSAAGAVTERVGLTHTLDQLPLGSD